MSQNFQPGDFLIFQLESGYALLRLLGIHEDGEKKTWHVAAYGDLFPDVEFAESAITNPSALTVASPHTALTTRAFESTQTARLGNVSLTESELTPFTEWQRNPDRQVSDRSIRLILGLR